MGDFTPGPWHLVADNGSDFTAISTIPHLYESKIDFDNEVLGSSEWLRVKTDDLRLMATAPDLLEALEELLQYTRSCEGLLNRLESEQCKNALIAIKKAKGLNNG